MKHGKQQPVGSTRKILEYFMSSPKAEQKILYFFIMRNNCWIVLFLKKTIAMARMWHVMFNSQFRGTNQSNRLI